MLLLFFLSLISAICFTQLFHPVAMLLMIIFMTFILIMMNFIFLYTSWLAYILFMVMLSGLLILFIYIISLTPNNKMIKLSFTPFIFLLLMYFLPQPFYAKDIYLVNPFYILTNITKTYFPNLMLMTVIMSLFLLFSLLIIVYILQFNKGPLRTSLYG